MMWSPDMRDDLLEFVKAAIRNPLEVATVFPTSRALAERLIEASGLEQGGLVAEVGCGTGAITRWIRPRLKDESQYVGVELNSDMVHFLRSEFNGMRFEEGPAEMLPELTGANQVSAVISSLPWTVFSDDLQKRTLKAILDSLKDGGVFVTYVCVNAAWYPQAQHLGGLLKGLFSTVKKTPIEWRNIPPAFVYVCTK